MPRVDINNKKERKKKDQTGLNLKLKDFVVY